MKIIYFTIHYDWMWSSDEDILKSIVSCYYFLEGTMPRDFHFLYRRESILSIVAFSRQKINNV